MAENNGHLLNQVNQFQDYLLKISSQLISLLETFPALIQQGIVVEKEILYLHAAAGVLSCFSQTSFMQQEVLINLQKNCSILFKAISNLLLSSPKTRLRKKQTI